MAIEVIFNIIQAGVINTAYTSWFEHNEVKYSIYNMLLIHIFESLMMYKQTAMSNFNLLFLLEHARELVII